MALSKTARLQADRAVRAIVRDYDPAEHTDVDDYLANASYEEAEARRITTIGQFDSDARGQRSYDNWMDWRYTVEREAADLIAHTPTPTEGPAEEFQRMIQCPRCRGTGESHYSAQSRVRYRDCPTCHGAGEAPAKPFPPTATEGPAEEPIKAGDTVTINYPGDHNHGKAGTVEEINLEMHRPYYIRFGKQSALWAYRAHHVTASAPTAQEDAAEHATAEERENWRIMAIWEQQNTVDALMDEPDPLDDTRREYWAGQLRHDGSAHHKSADEYFPPR